MSLLLDTQALLWFVLDDSRLSAKAREQIVATDAEEIPVVSSDALFDHYGVGRIW